MAKLLHLVTIFIILGLSFAHQKNHPSWFYNFFGLSPSITSICANNNAQSTYLAQTLLLINTFQVNPAYSSILQGQSPNFIAYIQNLGNQGLLYSNCTGFVTGVKIAKATDEVLQRARQQTSQEIYQRLRQVSRNATGTNGPTDVDGAEF